MKKQRRRSWWLTLATVALAAISFTGFGGNTAKAASDDGTSKGNGNVEFKVYHDKDTNGRHTFKLGSAVDGNGNVTAGPIVTTPAGGGKSLTLAVTSRDTGDHDARNEAEDAKQRDASAPGYYLDFTELVKYLNQNASSWQGPIDRTGNYSTLKLTTQLFGLPVNGLRDASQMFKPYGPNGQNGDPAKIKRITFMMSSFATSPLDEITNDRAELDQATVELILSKVRIVSSDGTVVNNKIQNNPLEGGFEQSQPAPLGRSEAADGARVYVGYSSRAAFARIAGDGTWHYYNLMAMNDTYAQGADPEEITWVEAFNKAKSKRYHGLIGYLATITNEDEQKFVDDNIRLHIGSATNTGLGWLGGTRGMIPAAGSNARMYLQARTTGGSDPWDSLERYQLTAPTGDPYDKSKGGLDVTGSRWYWADGPESLGDPNNATIAPKAEGPKAFNDSINGISAMPFPQTPPNGIQALAHAYQNFASSLPLPFVSGQQPDNDTSNATQNETWAGHRYPNGHRAGEFFVQFGPNGGWDDYPNYNDPDKVDPYNPSPMPVGQHYVPGYNPLPAVRYYYVEYSAYGGMFDDLYNADPANTDDELSAAYIPAPLEYVIVDGDGNPINGTNMIEEYDWGNIGEDNKIPDLETFVAPTVPGFKFVRVYKDQTIPTYYNQTFEKVAGQGPGVFDQYVQYLRLIYVPVDNKYTVPGTGSGTIPGTPGTPTIPETPTEPEKPTTPETPVVPETPTIPEVNGKPSATNRLPKGEAIYNINKVGLYKSTNFTKANRIKTYAKRTRVNRYQFIVKGYAYGSNGALRYYVQQYNPYTNRYIAGTKGYVTASRKFIQPVYYKAAGTKRVKVINQSGVKAYGNKQLTNYKKLYKKGVTLKVKKVVKQKYATRFQLSNGLYITANKKFVIMK